MSNNDCNCLAGDVFSTCRDYFGRKKEIISKEKKHEVYVIVYEYSALVYPGRRMKDKITKKHL